MRSYIHLGVISRDMLTRKGGRGGAIARCEGYVGIKGGRCGGEEGGRKRGRLSIKVMAQTTSNLQGLSSVPHPS